MHNVTNMPKSITNKAKSKTMVRKILTAIAVAGFVVLALFHLLFAQGAASIGIWAQAIPAILAVLTFALSTYRLVKGLPVASILFFGTLPLWLVHIPITILVEDESPIYVIATSITPAAAGIAMLAKYKKASI